MDDTRYKVLLIEDDKIDRVAFKRLVRDENLPYDYMIAGCVSEAQNILSSNEFDVAIIDYLLGDGTAFDLLDSMADTPVIFATGAGNEELAVKAMKAGACDYLIKDFKRNYLKVLPEVMKNAISHKKAQDELKQYHNHLELLVKERTEQLAAEKELLSVTLSSMGDGVIAVDAGKRITLFNKVAENLLGWQLEQVRGKSVDEILRVINEQTEDVVESPIDKVISSGQIEMGSDRDALITRDGGERPITTTAAPIRKNGGTVIGVVVVLHDVSREREVDNMKTDFISSVSHELRTPLTSVKAYTATILRDPNMLEQTKRQFLGIIDEESNRLASLVEDLLEISRIESGTVKIARQDVYIADAIKSVLSALGPLADKKKIQLKADIADGLTGLPGDPDKIQSVFTNLISNSIKFTPEYGQISVSVFQKEQEVVIRVSDTGMGIPKESLPKIFGRFYRVHRPGKQIQGTGLGLAIVKEIVAMHAGRIEVESEVNQGTTFTVFLPLDTQAILYNPVTS